MKEKVVQKEFVKKDMLIGEAVEKYPQIAPIMTDYGLHCIGCHVNPFETIEQGALGHGMPQEDFERMLMEVNLAVAKGQPPSHQAKQPDTFKEKVNATEAAAKKILEFMKQEGKEGQGLRISAMPGGCAGFQYSLEFDNPTQQDLTFKEYGITLIVSKNQIEILKDVTIDYVDGLQGTGFKIENPNATGSCGCGKSFH